MPDNANIIIYNRFFLHAINTEEELAFLSTASSLCENGGILACEFRTPWDSQLEKQTAEHYRRFVDAYLFCNSASKNGFRVTYAAEGFGFAKYKNDDAYVCRLILTRPS